MNIRTSEIRNENSLPYGHLESYEVNHSSTEESDETNGLAIKKFELDNQPLQSGNRAARECKEKT